MGPLTRCLLASATALFISGPSTAASDPLTNLHAASYQAAAAPDSLVTASGANLATATQSAGSVPLPESLAGTSVKVRDSAGAERHAGILSVSPNQVNYLLPGGTSSGNATVTIQNSEGVVSQGSLLVQQVAPGLFSANGNGTGAAAAEATGVSGGAQTTLPAFRFDQTYGRYLTSPINVLPSADGVTLSIYGTGIRGAQTVAATLGVQPVPVIAAGASATHPGLDKVDIQVPRSLANRGIATLQLTADGVQSNPVTIEILHYQYLNFGFESVTSSGSPWYWVVYGPGYDIAVDTSVHRSGSRSLRITNVSALSPVFANASQTLPLADGLEAAKGKHLRFSAYIKVLGMTRDWAGLWLRVDGPSGMISIDNAPCATESSDWQKCVIDRDVSPDATGGAFGILQTGDGTAWYDDLQIEIDGAVYPENPPISGPPTVDQLSWVGTAANSLATPDAGNGFDDLAFVKDMVGDAHIVGLGEGTHGTSEFFRLKYRLLEYLATNMGFNVFAIEASMPEAYRLNDYVLNGVGDPAALLKGMYFWTWNTREVLDMILWMRQFNASGKGRLQFTGFDMQFAAVAISNVEAFVQRADPSYLRTVTDAYVWAQAINTSYLNGATPPVPVAYAVPLIREVWQYLERHRSDYLENFSAADIDWAIQNGRIVEQATQIASAGSGYRDQCMAANIDWILQRNPGAKMVVWAHNAHTSRTPYGAAMGSYLARAHDTDYLPIAQLFHAGRYNALSNGHLVPNDAVPSYPGTLEYVLHSTGMPRLVLDLRKLATDDPGSAWLLGDMEWRLIGAVAANGWQQRGTLTWEYDAIIFFDQTTPSTLLPF